MKKRAVLIIDFESDPKHYDIPDGEIDPNLFMARDDEDNMREDPGYVIDFVENNLDNMLISVIPLD